MDDTAIITSQQTGFFRWIAPACILICVFGLLAYANSFLAPFVFDDSHTIVENPSIRRIWPDSLRPPADQALAGRPITNFTLALNYAISRLGPWSYHVANLAIHIAAALLLFGITRRTLALLRMRAVFGRDASILALLCALAWMLHPVQTGSVTYACMRCESLMGMLFLAALYAAIRGWQSPKPIGWHLAAALAFTLGVGVKEVIIAAPLVIFLYPIVFMKEKPFQVLRKSPLLFGGFLPGILILAILVAGGGSKNFLGKPPFSQWEYLVTQPLVIAHYIRLAFWPSSLCMDYRWPAFPLAQTWPYALCILALLAGSAFGLYKKHPLGFAGAWFFLILAPTSSIMPLRDVIYEYRMYLPLAAVIWLAVLGGYWALQRLFGTRAGAWAACRAAGAVGLALAVLVLAGLTFARNMDYKTVALIWADTAAKSPTNTRAYTNLGLALLKEGRWKESITASQKALALLPANPEAHINLANALSQIGKSDEAARHYQEAMRLCPEYQAPVHYDIGLLLAGKGELSSAAAHFQMALKANPRHVNARLNLGNVYLLLGDTQKSIRLYKEVLAQAPDFADAHANLANALLRAGDRAQALAHLKTALALSPDNPTARNLALSLEKL